MRFAIPLPDQLPMRWIIGGAGGLLLGQLLTGTSEVHAELVFLFVVLSGLAVNLAGGLRRLGGLCIAMMSLKIVVISQVAKVLCGEPGDSRLEMPVTTLSALLLGLASMTCAVACLRLIRVRTPLLHTDTTPEALRIGGILTFALGAVSHLGVMSTGMEEGQLQVGGVPGLFRQLAFCISLSVIFCTAHVIQRSEGRALLGWFNVVPAGFFFSLGVIASSKQGMFEPLLLIGLTGVAFGYRFSLAHVAGGVAFLVLALGVLFPFGQVARNHTRGSGIVESLALTGEFTARHLGSLEGFRELHQQYNEGAESIESFTYYEHSSMALERLSLIKPVDLLIAATVRDGESGWETITHGFKMVLPRFLYPYKPAVNTGTFLGKKAGLLPDEDFGTQVSFGFIADAFSAFGWAGAAIIPGVATFFFLLLFNCLVGGFERSVWCVYFFAEFQHFFAEQTVSAMTLTILRRPIWLVGLYVALRVAWAVARIWRAGRPVGGEGRPGAVDVPRAAAPAAWSARF